jgi:hypothetical protein
VKMVVVNQTRYLHGAHATTMLINDFVNGRLGHYGSGVERIDVTLLYPPKSRPGRSPGGFAGFWNMVGRSPRATFLRAKRRIDIRYVCSGVSVRSIEADGHLTQDEVAKIATAAASALELIRPKVRPDDRFDHDAFLRDAQSALFELPEAIQPYLKPGGTP